MTSTEYIVGQLSIIHDKCPELSIQYGYNELYNIHYVRVLPKSSYNSDSTYRALESEFLNGFINQFPFEGLSIVSVGDTFEVDEILWKCESRVNQTLAAFERINREGCRKAAGCGILEKMVSGVCSFWKGTNPGN